MTTLNAALTYHTNLLHFAETDTICGQPYPLDALAKMGRHVELFRRLLLTHDGQLPVRGVNKGLWEQVSEEVEAEARMAAFGDLCNDYTDDTALVEDLAEMETDTNG